MPDEQTESGAPLADHLVELANKRLHKLASRLDFTGSADPVDAVHDLRVASRRLRAFALVFRDVLGGKLHARLERRLRAVTKAAGAIRDWDVQIGLLEARLERGGSDLERASVEHLLEGFDVQRSRAAKKAEKRLGKVDVDSLSAMVRRAVHDTIRRLMPAGEQRAYAATLLERLVAEATSHVPPAYGDEHAELLHQLRIDVKGIRYALELFEPVLGSRYEDLAARATAAQELLGAHHDLTVLGGLVAERANDLEASHRQALSAGMRRLEGALAAERAEVLARFQSSGFEPNGWRDTIQAALGAGPREPRG